MKAANGEVASSVWASRATWAHGRWVARWSRVIDHARHWRALRRTLGGLTPVQGRGRSRILRRPSAASLNAASFTDGLPLPAPHAFPRWSRARRHAHG